MKIVKITPIFNIWEEDITYIFEFEIDEHS